MADNTATARKQLAGHRDAVREHIEKYRRYVEPYEKDDALKTVVRVQDEISKLKDRHPSLRYDTDPLDTWKP